MSDCIIYILFELVLNTTGMSHLKTVADGADTN